MITSQKNLGLSHNCYYQFSQGVRSGPAHLESVMRLLLLGIGTIQIKID